MYLSTHLHILLIAIVSLTLRSTFIGVTEVDGALCIGHRGWSAKYPENTVESVRRAFELGADGAKIDVQLTADGEIVVIHDDTLDRTTNGTGRVSKRNWYGYIDSLDILELLTLDDTTDVFILLDIKPVNGVIIIPMISEIIKSFKYEFRTQVQLGYDLKHAESSFASANAFSMYYPSVVEDRSGFIRHIHRKDKSIYVWPVDDEEEMENAIDSMGVDGLITDYPDICLNVRRAGLRRD
ncbi:PLC-like phosphodiesterase [Chytridium lagenaria]|nr:PLC-like phosphodiesterase [Chytridium lagenaria]